MTVSYAEFCPVEARIFFGQAVNRVVIHEYVIASWSHILIPRDISAYPEWVSYISGVKVIQQNISAVMFSTGSDQFKAFNFGDVQKFLQLTVIICWGDNRKSVYRFKLPSFEKITFYQSLDFR